MSVNFGTLKTQIGQRVGDTSSTFATMIGTYINQRYKDVLRRTNWDVINYDYVVSASSASASYTLPTNFGKELYVWDSVNLVDVPYSGIENLEQAYQNEKNDTGTVEYYSIYNTTTDLTEPSAARVKKIKFWRSIGASACFEVPYIVYPMDMSASSEIPVLECERAIEFGATCDAWLYKRQFAKATSYEQLYEKEIQNLIWNQGNQPNQLPMMNVLPLNRDEGI
jgi:hypothetical protein